MLAEYSAVDHRRRLLSIRLEAPARDPHVSPEAPDHELPAGSVLLQPGRVPGHASRGDPEDWDEEELDSSAGPTASGSSQVHEEWAEPRGSSRRDKYARPLPDGFARRLWSGAPPRKMKAIAQRLELASSERTDPAFCGNGSLGREGEPLREIYWSYARCCPRVPVAGGTLAPPQPGADPRRLRRGRHLLTADTSPTARYLKASRAPAPVRSPPSRRTPERGRCACGPARAQSTARSSAGADGEAPRDAAESPPRPPARRSTTTSGSVRDAGKSMPSRERSRFTPVRRAGQRRVTRSERGCLTCTRSPTCSSPLPVGGPTVHGRAGRDPRHRLSA